jgi:P4 family phage/plasmid primase-like protien
MTTFTDWGNAGFAAETISVTPPDAPLSPGSKIRSEDRGKAPGRRNGEGTWGGFDWQGHKTTKRDLAKWTKDGANIGLRAAQFPGLDIDVMDEGLAKLIEAEAKRLLGAAPRRIGRAPKRLLAYRTSTPFGRMWLRFKAAGSEQEHLVELLGNGQQYVVGGMHPATKRPYQWDREPAAEALTEIDREKAEAFFAGLTDLLDMLGHTVIERAGSGATTDRTKIDQDALKGDVETVGEAVALIPNTSELFPDRSDYIRMGLAIRAACADDIDCGFEFWADWCGRYDGPGGNDPEEVTARWASFKPPFEIGARYLYSLAVPYGFNAAAEDFEALDDTPEVEQKPDERPVEYSDAALAHRFRAKHGEDIKHVAEMGKWLIWDDQRWTEDTTNLVFDLSEQICCAASGEALRTIESASKADRIARKVASGGVINAVPRIAQGYRVIARNVCVFDADPWMLNTPDGIVDLRTGELLPHDRGAYCSKITAAGPGPVAYCPKWLKFLAEVTKGDAELVAYLQRVIGYSLTGSIREHAFFFAYGPGGNGKGVFTNTIQWLLQDYGATIPMDALVASRSDRHPTEMAMLRGARFTTARETEEGRHWAESRIKQLTGGDPVTARFMHKNFFTYQPQCKVFIIGNHMPRLRNVDDAMKRRLHLIRFDFKPPEVTPDLEKMFEPERPGILRWAIDGCLEWQRVGLQAPKIVRATTEDYFAEEDLIGRWLGERCREEKDAKLTNDQLFNDWCDWCQANGEDPHAKKTFSEALANKGVKRWRTEAERGFTGLALVSVPGDEFPADG